MKKITKAFVVLESGKPELEEINCLHTGYVGNTIECRAIKTGKTHLARMFLKKDAFKIKEGLSLLLREYKGAIAPPSEYMATAWRVYETKKMILVVYGLYIDPRENRLASFYLLSNYISSKELITEAQSLRFIHNLVQALLMIQKIHESQISLDVSIDQIVFHLSGPEKPFIKNPFYLLGLRKKSSEEEGFNILSNFSSQDSFSPEICCKIFPGGAQKLESFAVGVALYFLIKKTRVGDLYKIIQWGESSQIFQHLETESPKINKNTKDLLRSLLFLKNSTMTLKDIDKFFREKFSDIM